MQSLHPEPDTSTDEVSASLLSRLESILFIHGAPVSFRRLSDILDIAEDEVRPALSALRRRYDREDSGLFLLVHGDEAELTTSPANASLVEAFVAADREESLGKATLEVLSVIAYRSPVTRAEIDAIRGVNSSYSLRNLLLRGLIEREPNPIDSREFRYLPSFRLLELLGVASISELPDHGTLSSDVRVLQTVTDASIPASDPEILAA